MIKGKNDHVRKNLQHSPKAGDTQRFPSGVITYLAPLPLPTLHPAKDYQKIIGAMNDVYLGYGSGKATVFSWQMALGVPFTMFVMLVFLFPVIASIMALSAGGTWFDAEDFFFNMHLIGLKYGLLGCPFLLVVCLLTWRHARNKEKGLTPPRFNRQRREVCFVPDGGSKAYIVPWESLSVWTTEAQGVTQYGVQRQYALGIGFHDKQSNDDYVIEYPYSALPLAVSAWEAVRAYMEYEVHSLEDIHVADDLHRPGDPPYEGRRTFHNARQRLHRRNHDGEIGGFTVFGWYLYHIMTLWTLPAYIAEREAQWLLRRRQTEIPEKMAQWSEPLPEDQWAKPSELLKRQSAAVKRIWSKQQQAPLAAVFAEARSQTGDEELQREV